MVGWLGGWLNLNDALADKINLDLLLSVMLISASNSPVYAVSTFDPDH